MQTPNDSRTFFVSGGGSLSTVSDQFLTATLIADGAELGGYDWINWWLWTSTPINFNQSTNAFTVPAASGYTFHGVGYRDTDPWRLKINGLGEDANGQVYPATHTWEADFTQTKLGWTITLHVEGSYENL